MEVLFVFLKWVASFAHLDAETGSKMDLGNLATVICPSILYARGRDAMRDETFGGLRVMTSLLENQDEFFTVPEEFLPILHDQEYFASSLELPSKEFMKKCDTYMRIKGSNGRSTPGIFNSSSNSNGAAPRYPPPSSSVMERPTMAGPSGSERTLRPPPGMSQSTEFHPPSSSPSLPQGMMQNPQRTSQMDWTGPPPPRPVNPNGPSSRPSSFVGPPPSRSTASDSTNHSQHSYNSTPPNGYSPAVRQRS